MRSRRLLLAALVAITPAIFVYAIATGSVPLSWNELRHALLDVGDANTMVITELRLPRALSAFAVGGMLGLAGALLQVLLRNPLADPFVLGVSGGASVAVLLAMLLGAGATLIGLAGFGGALAAMLLVFGLSRAGGNWTQSRLLLTGVVLASGWAACISLLLSIAPGDRVQGMLFWLLGDLSYAHRPGLGLATLGLGLALALLMARPLNLLARGEHVAATLGAHPVRLRLAVYFVASILTAISVTLAGSIGFVGLVIPHMLRLLGGADHRFVLPGAVLLGGNFLMFADTLARSVLAPIQLPVGVFTALLGVPIFLYLLNRTAGASASLG